MTVSPLEGLELALLALLLGRELSCKEKIKELLDRVNLEFNRSTWAGIQA
jgi:hypothetical protein